MVIDQVMDLRPEAAIVAAAPLSTTERAELGRYEKVIERGLETFISVGNALLCIRKDRLYRETYPTWEAYCEQRWKITYNFANKLIGAAQVVENLGSMGTIVPILPATESQARPLTKLSPDEQREAYQTAIDDAGGKQPTAAQVTRAVERLRPPTPAPTPAPAKAVYVEAEMPDDLKAVGYELVRYVGEQWGWRWNNSGGSYTELKFCDTPAKAINSARKHWELLRATTKEADPEPAPIDYTHEPVQGPKPNLAHDELEVHPMNSWMALPQKPVVQAPSEPKPSIVAPEWITHTLARASVEGADFASALGMATAEQLGEVLDALSAPGNEGRRVALKRRLRKLEGGLPAVVDPDAEELEQEADDLQAMGEEPQPAKTLPLPPLPDERLEDAQNLRLCLVECRELCRRQFGELTGRHGLLPAYERSVADMVEPLDSLISILSKEQPR